MKVVKILSDTGIDCIQANIKIVIPPTPNIAFNNMAKPSSLIVLPPFRFYLQRMIRTQNKD